MLTITMGRNISLKTELPQDTFIGISVDSFDGLNLADVFKTGNINAVRKNYLNLLDRIACTIFIKDFNNISWGVEAGTSADLKAA